MTCKDCVHYDVCKDEYYKDFALFGAGANYGEYSKSIPKCAYYKNKSRLIELPCKVGDTIYFIHESSTAENFGKRYVDWIIVGRISFDGADVYIYGSNCFSERVFNSKGVGKICFLSRDEAEKALEEMERGST